MLHIIHLRHRIDRKQLLINELIKQEITQYKIWPGIINLKNRQLGIYQAHCQIVKQAERNGLPSVTIAEDDICFSSHGAYRYFLDNEPDNYDLYLGGIIYGRISTDFITSDFAGATLYRISRRFFTTFLNLPEQGNFDRNLKGLGIFKICNPMVAYQYNGLSDNQDKFLVLDPYIKRHTWYRK